MEGLPDQQASQAIPIGQTAALATAVNRDETQYMIRGDALRLENVLVHFISNAVQHSKANHVIRIKVRQRFTVDQSFQSTLIYRTL